MYVREGIIFNRHHHHYMILISDIHIYSYQKRVIIGPTVVKAWLLPWTPPLLLFLLH